MISIIYVFFIYLVLSEALIAYSFRHYFPITKTNRYITIKSCCSARNFKFHAPLRLFSSVEPIKSEIYNDIFVLPDVTIPISSVVGFIHHWANETTSIGSGMIMKKDPRGVIIHFKPSLGSFLNIFAFSEDARMFDSRLMHTIAIRSHLSTSPTNSKRMNSLLKTASDNVIESLKSKIQTAISTSKHSQASNTKDVIVDNSSNIATEEIVSEKPKYDLRPFNHDETINDCNELKEVPIPIKRLVEEETKSNEESVDDSDEMIKNLQSIPAFSKMKVIDIDEDSDTFKKLKSRAEFIDFNKLKELGTPPSVEELYDVRNDTSIENVHNHSIFNPNAGYLDFSTSRSPPKSDETDLNKTDILFPAPALNWNNTSPSDLLNNESITNISAIVQPTVKTESSTGIIESKDVMNELNSTKKFSEYPSSVSSNIIAVNTTDGLMKSTSIKRNSTEKTLFTWPAKVLPEIKLSIVKCLQRWVDKLSGVGVLPGDIDDGVSLSFVGSTAYLLLRVAYHDDCTVLLSIKSFPNPSDNSSALQFENIEKVVIPYLEKSVIESVSEIDVSLSTDYESLDNSGRFNKPILLSSNERFDGFRNNEEFLKYTKKLIDSAKEDKLKPFNHAEPIDASFTGDPFARLSDTTQPKRNPVIDEAAQELGLNLKSYENKGVGEQAIEDLNKYIRNSQREGFVNVLKNFHNYTLNSSTMPELPKLFNEGANISKYSWQSMLNRTGFEGLEEDLSKPPFKVPVNFKASGFTKGFDMLQGPPSFINPQSNETINKANVTEYDLISPYNPKTLELDKKRLDILVSELGKAPDEYHDVVIDSYRDLLLSDNFIYMIREANETESDYPKRLLYSKISKHAVKLVVELAELMQQQNLKQLQTIEAICEVAANYQQDELTFLDRIDALKPRFDTNLLAYLNYAVDEERYNQLRKGVDPDTAPSNWLLILKVIKQGVLAEFEVRYGRLLEPLLIIIRFDQRIVREDLFIRFVNKTAPMDLKHMKTLAMNMIEGVEHKLIKNPNLVDAKTIANLKDLRVDVEKYLSDEYIDEKTKEFIKTAEKHGVEVNIALRNPIARSDIELEKELLAQAEENLKSKSISTVSGSVFDAMKARNKDTRTTNIPRN